VNKTVIFAAGFIFLMLVSCGKKDEVLARNELQMHERLALMHLRKNHEASVEELQRELNVFLAGSSNHNFNDEAGSGITGVDKFTVVIENGFSSARSEIPFYLFGLADPWLRTTGYALACGDIRFPGILAVVEEGDFYGDNPYFPVFAGNLADLIIDTIQIYNSRTPSDIASALKKWKKIRDPGQDAGIYTQHVFPLTRRTEWGQGPHYYNVISAVHGRPPASRWVTGPVPAAMAQIMAYFEWPAACLHDRAKSGDNIINANPLNSVSVSSFMDPYSPNDEIVEFHDVNYDWKNMTRLTRSSLIYDRYKVLICVLMFEIASNINTEYGTKEEGGSRADFANIPPVLSKMGYAKVKPSGYSFKAVKESLDQRFPVLAGARTHYGRRDVFFQPLEQEWLSKTTIIPSEKGAEHAWIIDDYRFVTRRLPVYDDENTPDANTGEYNYTVLYLHHNLGWNGDSNGWYFSYTGRGKNFVYDQKIIANIKPANLKKKQ